MPGSVPGTGGTYTLAVTTGTGCAWTAEADVSWARVAPSAGQGSATPVLTVDENMDANNSRSASVTVAGQVARFSQANGLPADTPGMTDAVTDPKLAGERIFKNIPAWAPPVPAPIDVKSVNWAIERYHANWDGNQGASSRTLASGASATGDPRMVKGS